MKISQQKAEAKHEFKNFDLFIDFIKKLLIIDPNKRYTASQAINHPFIKFYPKSSEKIPTDCNDYDETEEDEEKELLQIGKMNQETRPSSPPSKQDSSKQSFNTQTEDNNKKKNKKIHHRNWNSFTEFKTNSDFEEPPFLNQFNQMNLNNIFSGLFF